MKAKSCRLCLAVDLKVFVMGNTAKHFLEIIFRENGCKQALRDSHYICYLCKVQLENALLFIQRVLKAQEVLTNIMKEGKKITLQILKDLDRKDLGLDANLITHQFENIDFCPIDGKTDESIKHTPLTLLDCVKEEYAEISDDSVHSECHLEIDLMNPLSIKNENLHNKQHTKLHKKINGESDPTFDIVKFKREKKYGKEKTSKQISSNDAPKKKYGRPKLLPSKFMLDLPFVGDKRERKQNKKYTFDDNDNGSETEQDQHVLKKSCDKLDPEFQLSSSDTEESDHSNYGDRGLKLVKPSDWRTYPMTCDHCDYEIPAKKDHYKHYLFEHPRQTYPYGDYLVQPTYLCPYCGRADKRKYLHDDHVLSHNNEKKYACKECPKRFMTPYRLNRHECNVHTKKLKECDYCGKRFKVRSDIIRHLRIHTGEKPYKCHICDTRFGLRLYLKSHIRTNHQQCPRRKKKNPCTNSKKKRKYSNSEDDLPLQTIMETLENIAELE